MVLQLLNNLLKSEACLEMQYQGSKSSDSNWLKITQHSKLDRGVPRADSHLERPQEAYVFAFISMNCSKLTKHA